MDASTVAHVSKDVTPAGQTVTKVVIDGVKLGQAVGATASETIVLEVSTSDSVVLVEIPADMFKNAGNRLVGRVLKISVGEVNYSLPLSMLRDAAVDGTVTVTIAKQSAPGEAFKSALINAGVTELLAIPVEFTVEVNGKEMTGFNGTYVERTIGLDQAADSAKTTAVWVDSSGAHFAPSLIVNQNGRAQVTIYSPHNSLYTVVRSDKSFSDLKDHWAKEEVHLLANKLIVNGTSPADFSPDLPITRGEFAALLVRSLGLKEEKAEVRFEDVQAAAWYAGAVGAAWETGLVSGYEDGRFHPDAAITREQMASMLARALAAGGKPAKSDLDGLKRFDDQAAISEWAKEAVGQALAAQIIEGETDRTFAGSEHATRAQSAVMLKRMLTYLQFIN